MLNDLPLLAKLGRGLLTTDELELLHQRCPTAGEVLDAADLPALAYLHAHANGIPVPVYDHIVVDEAQDVAPLSTPCCGAWRAAARSPCWAIWPGIYSYRTGLSAWDEVRQVFDGLPYTYTEASESYRSTHEIISFSKHVLELLAPPGRPPRSSPSPCNVTAPARRAAWPRPHRRTAAPTSSPPCATCRPGLRQHRPHRQARRPGRRPCQAGRRRVGPARAARRRNPRRL